MKSNTPGLVLVVLQFSMLLYLLLTTSFSLNYFSLVLILTAIEILIWSAITMRKSRLRILPEPSPEASLITSGPYRFVRHPMYTSLILGSTGLLVMDTDVIRGGIWLLLVFVLILKLNLEEKLLKERFPMYSEYMKSTSRLVPYFY